MNPSTRSCSSSANRPVLSAIATRYDAAEGGSRALPPSFARRDSRCRRTRRLAPESAYSSGPESMKEGRVRLDLSLQTWHKTWNGRKKPPGSRVLLVLRLERPLANRYRADNSTEGCSMKKIRTRHVVTPLVLFGLVLFAALVAGLTGSSMAATSEMPGGTNFQPSSAYVAPTAAGTKLGQYNIARFKEIVKTGLNEGDLSVIDTHVSPTVVDHQFYGPGYPRKRLGIKALTAALRTGFPDLHAVPTTLVASSNGAQTFAIIRTTGTNTGSYLGVPPTGKKVTINIQESALWKNGVMVEHWGVVDNIGLLAQMGLFPLDQFPNFDVKKLDKS